MIKINSFKQVGSLKSERIISLLSLALAAGALCLITSCGPPQQPSKQQPELKDLPKAGGTVSVCEHPISLTKSILDQALARKPELVREGVQTLDNVVKQATANIILTVNGLTLVTRIANRQDLKIELSGNFENSDYSTISLNSPTISRKYNLFVCINSANVAPSILILKLYSDDKLGYIFNL